MGKYNVKYLIQSKCVLENIPALSAGEAINIANKAMDKNGYDNYQIETPSVYISTEKVGD